MLMWCRVGDCRRSRLSMAASVRAEEAPSRGEALGCWQEHCNSRARIMIAHNETREDESKEPETTKKERFCLTRRKVSKGF